MAPYRLIVIGGGCYGHLHASRLLTAQARGKIAGAQVVVVDRDPDCQARRTLGEKPDLRYAIADWDAYLEAYLDGPDVGPDDQIVPAPLAPHLLYTWLEGALRRALPARAIAREPVAPTFEQPYARTGGDGAFYFSFADWICPVSCIEPARCPAIKAPRTWEQEDFLRDFVAAEPRIAGLATFVCRHFAWGVGTVPVSALLEARARLVELARRQPEAALTFWAATVSACHGAVGQIGVGPRLR